MLLSGVIDGQLVFGGGDFWAFTATRGAWIEVVMFFCVWVYITVSRHIIVQQAWRSIRPDVETYVNLWDATVADDACAHDALRHLEQLVAAYDGKGTGGRRSDSSRIPLHQCTVTQSLENTVVQSRGAAMRAGGWGMRAIMCHRTWRRVSSAAGQRVETLCLDQLYLQAKLLWPTFNDLVFKWAAASNGKLVFASSQDLLHASVLATPTAIPSKSKRGSRIVWGVNVDARGLDAARGGVQNDVGAAAGAEAGAAAGGSKSEVDYDRFDLIWNGELPLPQITRLGRQRGIQWAPIKKVKRAVEKAQRSYSGKVSRLVDVVRQCIVFSNLTDLCRCLTAISEDPSVRLLRVKNRFTQAAAKMSAGYRDVSINLVIVTPETVSSGVSGHVCELQLLLEQFFRVKTEQGHLRYVDFRNRRAE